MSMRTYANALNVHATPQSQPIPGREAEMAVNNAGGFGFAIDDWKRLERFLILGSENGTYYTTEQKLTEENTQALRRCISVDPMRVVRVVTSISDGGRAYRNDPALFALAATAAFALAPEAKHAAYEALPRVARIGTHLFHFAAFRTAMGGTGMGFRKAISRWYKDKSPEALVRQLVKYQSRDGWSNRDLLRLAHTKPNGEVSDAAFSWAVGKSKESFKPPLMQGFDAAKVCTDKSTLLNLIDAHNLEREMLPTEFLKDPDVWAALLPRMGLTAMVRNLGNMSKVGLLKPLSQAGKLVVSRLSDDEALRSARVHPVQLFVALMTYKTGHGAKGSGTWDVVPRIVEALDDAVTRAFRFVEPSGKNFYLGMDVSGSMSFPYMMGIEGLSPAIGTAIMAMTIARTEKNYYIAAFSDHMKKLNINASDSLADAAHKTDNITFGRTDCAQPMLDALKRKLEVDTFVVLTDNETWAGGVHPTQALAQYRKEMQRPAKLVVVGMTASGFSIADPADAGMLDVVGFDTNVPAVISDFAKG